MTAEFRTVRVLKLLAGMDHATTDMVAEHLGCPPSELKKTLANMRARKVITTEDGKHRITRVGKDELSSPRQPKPAGLAGLTQPKAVSTAHARPQSEYLLARPSGMTMHPENSVMRRPVWAPEPWVPARPGADDHKQFASRGIV